MHRKYIIEKADGSPVDPEARYFILRYDADPHAWKALSAYAESIHRENPEFAADLRRELYDTDPQRRNERTKGSR